VLADRCLVGATPDRTGQAPHYHCLAPDLATAPCAQGSLAGLSKAGRLSAGARRPKSSAGSWVLKVVQELRSCCIAGAGLEELGASI
jgi:hypothetical protein